MNCFLIQIVYPLFYELMIQIYLSSFIDKYNLKHIDTGRILIEGLEKALITEEQGNTVWEQMLNKNRMLPEKSFSDYLKRHTR